MSKHNSTSLFSAWPFRILASCLFALAWTGVRSEAGPVDLAELKQIDMAVNAALARKELPGCVVVVLHKSDVIYRKAFGHRSLEPTLSLMGEEIVFDLASLTKPIATATAIVLLLEDGKLKLDDPVGRHLPAFRRKETEAMTLEQLLTHTSGLPAGSPVADFRDGKEKALAKIALLPLKTKPGERFVYSDLGFILLGLVVEKASGMPLNQFTQKRIFGPLGMRDTGFLPGPGLKKRAAPTEKRAGEWIQGEVHDPRAHLLSGVAGHAGLFSTADDLTIYSRMILNQGRHQGKAILGPETVGLMTAPRKVETAKGQGLRTYGWDMDTPFSSNRGEVFAKGTSFGHTGFTGTSLWFDPAGPTAVIFLSNRVHPDGKGNVTKLRGQIATIAGKAVRASGN